MQSHGEENEKKLPTLSTCQDEAIFMISRAFRFLARGQHPGAGMRLRPMGARCLQQLVR